MAFVSKQRFLVENYVADRISWLLRQREQSPSQYKANLAHLRSSVATPPGANPDVWGIEFSGLPASLAGTGADDPTEGEWAVHLALSLFAVHQQSQDAAMYRRNNDESPMAYSFGHAVNRLTRVSKDGQGEELEKGEMPARFAAFVTAESIEELAHYARQIAQQLRAAGIPVDYARFAGQLYDWQLPYRRNQVRLEWGREFAAFVDHSENKEQEAEA